MAIASLTQDTAAFQPPPAVHRKTSSTEAMASRDSSDWERYEAPESEMTFWDFLDVINPLQHIPVINTAYRQLTGDTISPHARVMGGMLYGGPIGGMAAVANATIEQRDGRDIGDQLYAALGFGSDDSASVEKIAVASAPAATTQPRMADPSQGPVRTLGSLPTPAPMTAPATAAPAMVATAPATLATITAPTAGQTTIAALDMPPTEGRLVDGRSPPSKMPLRDTPLASSSLARYANSGPRVAAGANTGMSSRSVSSANLMSGLIAQEMGNDAPASAKPRQTANAGETGNAPGQAPDTAFGTPVPTEYLSDVMLRNLSKYENGRRAAQQPADEATAVRLSS